MKRKVEIPKGVKTKYVICIDDQGNGLVKKGATYEVWEDPLSNKHYKFISKGTYSGYKLSSAYKRRFIDELKDEDITPLDE